MDEQVRLGVIAIGAGILVGIVLFVPFVVISYRRRGAVSFARFVLWGAFLVYFLAIWTYTLLPLPDPGSIRCAGTNLDVFAFIDDVRGAIARPGSTLTDPAVLQLLLNVALFVPLGFFLRVLGGRGVVVAALLGLGISVFIETTQLTGVWGVYPCAYRVFDVDDMLTNTTGAVLGSLLSLVVPRRHRGSAKTADADEPRPVTTGRRLLAVLCDALTAGLLSTFSAVGVQLWLEYVVGDHDAVVDGAASAVAGAAVPLIAFAVVVLATGRTVGDIAVELQWSGGPVPRVLRRPLRYLGGVGGWLLLGLLAAPWGGVAQAVFVVLTLVLVFTTKDRRGLAGLVSGQRLYDRRALTPRESPGTPVPRP